jgi:hypothetical protein
MYKTQIPENPEKNAELPIFTRKEFCDTFHVSQATLDRKVREKKVKKLLVLGPKSPRYMLVPEGSDSE